MNDFTKEELVKLWRCINPVIIGDDAYDLKIKVRDMIDNYDKECQHTLTLTDTFTKCAHCNKILGY